MQRTDKQLPATIQQAEVTADQRAAPSYQRSSLDPGETKERLTQDEVERIRL